MKLSIVIPVYNEGDVINQTLTKLKNVVKIPHEVLIVYDQESDNTIAPIKKIQKIYPSVRLVKNKHGKGALNALKTGLEQAKGQAVCVMMADLTDDPKIISEMLKKFNEGASVISASRYMQGGKQIDGPFFKQLLSKTAGITLHYLTGLPTHDATNSFRMYAKNFLNKTKIESNGGFEVALELTVKAFFNGYKVSEIPTTWTYLPKQSRFMLKKWLPKYLKWYAWAIYKKLSGYPRTKQYESEL